LVSLCNINKKSEAIGYKVSLLIQLCVYSVCCRCLIGTGAVIFADKLIV